MLILVVGKKTVEKSKIVLTVGIEGSRVNSVGRKDNAESIYRTIFGRK